MITNYLRLQLAPEVDAHPGSSDDSRLADVGGSCLGDGGRGLPPIDADRLSSRIDAGPGRLPPQLRREGVGGPPAGALPRAAADDAVSFQLRGPTIGNRVVDLQIHQLILACRGGRNDLAHCWRAALCGITPARLYGVEHRGTTVAGWILSALRHPSPAANAADAAALQTLWSTHTLALAKSAVAAGDLGAVLAWLALTDDGFAKLAPSALGSLLAAAALWPPIFQCLARRLPPAVRAPLVRERAAAIFAGLVRGASRGRVLVTPALVQELAEEVVALAPTRREGAAFLVANAPQVLHLGRVDASLGDYASSLYKEAMRR